MHKSFSEKFGSHIPANSWAIVNKWFAQEDLAFRLSRSRGTKLGDFRFDPKSKLSVVSVNNDLNLYSFLITLTHEYAHYLAFKNFGRKVSPHGLEWKRTFGELLIQLNDLKCFPEDLSPLVIKHAKKPKASSNGDEKLYRALLKYNDDDVVHLMDLNIGQEFRFKKRLFKSVEKRRSRYLCLDLENKKKYLIPGTAVIQHG